MNFFPCYKPPSIHEKDFINELENVMQTVDHSDPLFIDGDLNFDIESNEYFDEFISSNNLVNFVKEPTRVKSIFSKI